MSDEKACPHCGKKLRSDNTRGACSDCLKARRGAGEAGASGKKPRSDTLKRFSAVARALGKDPHAILEEAAQVWLDKVAEAIG